MPEQQIPQQVEKKNPLKQSVVWGGSTFLATLPFEVFGHLGPTGLLVGGLASYVAWKHGPEIQEYVERQLRENFPERFAESPDDEPAQQGNAQEKPIVLESSRTFLQRAFGFYPEQPKEGEGQDTQATQYKGVANPGAEEWDESWYGEEEEVRGPAIGVTGRFTFSELLTSGFVPSLSAICIGRKADGTLITVAAKDLCHVALPGATGHGKSSLIRLIMSQLCYVGLPVYLLNPHYMVFDREHNEDWTPFTPYLKADPFACKDMKNIAKVLDWMVNQLLPARKERAAKGSKIGKPYFFVLDEVPDIVKEIPGASEKIGKILREGRKYGIYLIVASQDFSVKTLGVEGEGSVRKCFLTVLYVGGDPISVRELLNAQRGKVGDLVIDENALGKGPIIARYSVREKATDTLKVVVTLAQSPYTDNESLYKLLGPSTFEASDEEPEEEPPVYTAENDKHPDKQAVYDAVNEPVEPSGKVIQGPFINASVNEAARAQTTERAPVNEDIRKHIRRMNELGFAHRDISKVVGLYGPKYKLYQRVCAEEGISLEKEASV